MNKIIRIPYSMDFLELNIEEEYLKAVLVPRAHEYKQSLSQQELVGNALEKPMSSPRLCQLAVTAKRVLVITSDHTRPVPSKITIPILLKEIRSKNPDVKIKILIATGFHRPTSYDEMIVKFGKEIVETEEIINHDSRDISNMVHKGILPSGGDLWLNSLVDWADVIVSEGFIEPHFFAGFSGGRKSILPGIASEKTVLSNHCSAFVANKFARAGYLEGNPIHKDMLYAADAAKLKFILNVVIGEEKKIINVFAGDPVKAHETGCNFVKELAGVKACQADIVITSNGGYPLDQNIYQAVKGMTAAEVCVRQGGVIIMAAACNDGHGGEAFYNWFSNADSPKEVVAKIAGIPQQETLADQWEAQILARILTRCEVIMVTDRCDPKLISEMHMTHAKSLQTALELAREKVGKAAGITVIPDGVSVIVR